MIKLAITLVLATVAAFYGAGLGINSWIPYLPILLLLAWLNTRFRWPLLFFAAYFWAAFNIQVLLDRQLANEFDNQVLKVEGVIADIPERRPGSIRFLLRPDSIAAYRHALPELIRLNWYRGAPEIRAGERWQLQVKLRQPHGFKNPGGFDYERWLFVKKIGASGYVRTSPFNRRLEPASRFAINRWRESIAEGLERMCTDCGSRGLIKALTIGYRADIPVDQRRLLQDTGTAHLLAISGLHIGMISALFYLIGAASWHLGFYRLGFNRLQFGATMGFVAGLVYAALAGFSLPTVRALIMLAVVFLAICFRGGVNLLNSVAIAVTVILVVDPLAVGSASFWLSISALLIIAFAQYLLSHQTSRWRQALVVQLLFSVLFVPLGVLLFDQLNPASFFANIVAIPLVSLVVVPIALLASLVTATGVWGGEILFALGDRLLGLLLDYFELLLDSGLGRLTSGFTPYPLLALSALGLIILLMPRGFPAKKPAALLLLLPIIWQADSLEMGSYRLTLLDVGMGTSALIETRHHSLVYDFGPGNQQGYSAAKWVLIPYLRYRGIDRPDLMVVSHVDQDHSGGFISFRETFIPSRLLSGTPDELQQRFDLARRPRSCHAYPDWSWDGVDFEFISAPLTSELKSSNNRSCVLRVKGEVNLLLAGDIEAEQETRLLGDMPSRLRARVLLAPHHGSATSSTDEFLQAVNPRITLFTVGRNNRWGFPKTEVVEDYRALGSRIYRSDHDGAIIIHSSPGKLNLQSYRRRGLYSALVNSELDDPRR